MKILMAQNFHRNDSVRLYCLDCIGILAESSVYANDAIAENDGISKLVTLYNTYGHESQVGQRTYKIFKYLGRNGYKDALQKHGIDNLKKS